MSGFASTDDMTEKQVSFDELGPGLYAYTAEAFTSTLFAIVRAAVAKGADVRSIYAKALEKMRRQFGHWVIFDHCMPVNVSRAFDTPRIWTAERDVEGKEKDEEIKR